LLLKRDWIRLDVGLKFQFFRVLSQAGLLYVRRRTQAGKVGAPMAIHFLNLSLGVLAHGTASSGQLIWLRMNSLACCIVLPLTPSIRAGTTLLPHALSQKYARIQMWFDCWFQHRYCDAKIWTQEF
jgi:hypothetical protein